jgi:hypothetical protein
MLSQPAVTAPRSTAHIHKAPAALKFPRATFGLTMPLQTRVALYLIQTQSVSRAMFNVSLDTPTDGLLPTLHANAYQYQRLKNA